MRLDIRSTTLGVRTDELSNRSVGIVTSSRMLRQHQVRSLLAITETWPLRHGSVIFRPIQARRQRSSQGCYASITRYRVAFTRVGKPRRRRTHFPRKGRVSRSRKRTPKVSAFEPFDSLSRSCRKSEKRGACRRYYESGECASKLYHLFS